MIRKIIYKILRMIATDDLEYIFDPKGIRRWVKTKEALDHYLFRQIHIKEYQAIKQWMAWLECFDLASQENHRKKRDKYLSGCWVPGKPPFDYKGVMMNDEMKNYLDDLDKRFNRFMR